MQDTNNDLVGDFSFRRLGCRAGGFMTGVQVADDGRMIVRGDVMPAHFRDPSDDRWKPLVRPGDNVSAAFYQDNAFGGGGWSDGGAWGSYACAVHPTDSAIMASQENGLIWLTTNGSATIAPTNYPMNDVVGSNDTAPRTSGGARMAFDPANPTGQIFGLVDDKGFQYTTDQGETWVTHPDIPAPDSSRYYGILVFDRSSAVVSNATQTVYVFVYGSGIWRSTTGITGTFTLMDGSPTTAVQLVCDDGGKLHICGDKGDIAQYRYWTEAGGWVAPAGISGSGVAINPADNNKMFLRGNKGFRYSSDNGATWSDNNLNATYGGNEVVWRITTHWLGEAANIVIWLPGTSRIVGCDGFGMYYVEDMPTDGSSSYMLHEFSDGLDALIPMGIDVLPTGKVVITAQDHHWFMTTADKAHRPFHHSDGIEWRRKLEPENPSLTPNGNGNSVDWFTTNPECWAVASNKNFVPEGANPAALFLTQDDGITFKLVPPPPGLVLGGGNIALGFDGTQYIAIWLPANNQYPRYVTVDSIADLTSIDPSDWQPLLLDPTYTTTIPEGWYKATFIVRRCLVSDKNNDGTFYIFQDGDGTASAADLAMRGLWRITFSGGVPAATRIMDGYFTTFPYDFWHGKFRLNPLNSAHQFWCIGDSGPMNEPALDKQIQFSHDDWATKSPVGDLTEVYDFAFGKAAPGKTYPTIYAEGWKIGTPNVFGLHWCRDFDPDNPAVATWELIEQFPHGTHHQITVMAADMERFGRVYMGLGSEGGLVMDYAKTFTLV